MCGVRSTVTDSHFLAWVAGRVNPVFGGDSVRGYWALAVCCEIARYAIQCLHAEGNEACRRGASGRKGGGKGGRLESTRNDHRVVSSRNMMYMGVLRDGLDRVFDDLQISCVGFTAPARHPCIAATTTREEISQVMFFGASEQWYLQAFVCRLARSPSRYSRTAQEDIE